MTKLINVGRLTVGLCFALLLGSSSPALADDVTIQTGWSPFPYFYCSSCGPDIPLTLEQADGVGMVTGPAVTASELTLRVVGSNHGALSGAGQPSSDAPTTAAKSGVTVSSFDSHQLGHGAFNRDGDDDQDNVEKSEGLDYNVNVTTGHSGHGDDDAAFNDDQDQNEGNNHSTTFTSPNVDNISGGNTVSGGGESGQSLAPEPASLILLGSGLALLASRVRRRNAVR